MDQQRCAGVVPAPPAPDCVCGDAAVSHRISARTGRRTGCSVHTGPAMAPCGCRAYEPKAADHA